MTLPFENDTRIIVKKLAKRNLKADKSRNILIIITIALATCLIMTTTLYFFASQRKSLNDAAGRYQAIINEVDNDTITKLVNDDRVQVGVSHLLGLVSYGDYKLTVVSMLGLEDKLKNMPNNLSGGQQQRVAIARALVSKPAIVLADEPTGNLDSRTSADVLGLLQRTSREFNQTLVMITHNDAIAQLADRIVRIEDGKIVG